MKSSSIQKELADLSVKNGYTGDDFSDRAKLVRRLTERLHNKIILDVGCADGKLLAHLTPLNRVIGVDISQVLLNSASRNGYAETIQRDCSEEPLPFSDASVDCCVIAECIEHIADTDWVLSQINRVIKPGGILIVTFPNVRTPLSLLMMLLNRPPHMASRYRSGHVRDFTTRSVRLALENNGFEVQSMQGASFAYNPKLPHGCLPWIARFLPSWATTVVASARKQRCCGYGVTQDEVIKFLP